MEGSCNEQGGDSLANDWRTQHEPDLRRKVIFSIVKKLKIIFHQRNENDIKNMTFKFEDKIYGMATDKGDYLRKLCRVVLALNQGHSLSTSLPYTQTPTSQQWLPQNNIQSNLNSPESPSGLPTHAGQDTQENHLTSPQNKGEEEQEQTPRVSTSKQNNMSSFNVNGPSLVRTQGQEVEQSQPMMLQPNNHVQQKPENQPYQLQRTHPANNPPSTTNGGGDDWREETYQKIKALKEKYVHGLSTLYQTISDKLREIDSRPQKKKLYEPSFQRLSLRKATLEQVLVFLNVTRSSVSEKHRDKFSGYECNVLRFNECHQTLTRRTIMQQQRQLPDPISAESPVSNDNQIQTESQEHPPLVTLPPETLSERLIDRLIKAIQSSSPESLAESVSEMRSIISWTDRFAGSANPIGGFRARLGEDLSERTRFRLQQGDTNPTKRFKRSITAIIPLDYTASSSSKVNKIEPSYSLLQEIIEINGRLVETVVSICNEDACPSEEVTSGSTVVTCSYVPVALSATFKALYNSEHISQIQPLRLLVPENYPYSPIILDKVLFDTASVHKYEDLCARARSRFGMSMTEYSEPMCLKDIAKVWDECAELQWLSTLKGMVEALSAPSMVIGSVS